MKIYAKVDGGLIDPVPLQSIVDMGSDITLAVNLYGLQTSFSLKCAFKCLFHSFLSVSSHASLKASCNAKIELIGAV